MEEQNLNQKLKEIYPEAVVDKSLLLQQEVRGLPRFVSEWLISKFCPEKKEKDKVLF